MALNFVWATPSENNNIQVLFDQKPIKPVSPFSYHFDIVPSVHAESMSVPYGLRNAILNHTRPIKSW